MNSHDRIKLFQIAAQMCERDLDKVEDLLKVDLSREDRLDERDEDYYPQFTAVIRAEASAMAEHYDVFYCLERSIRVIVRERLVAELGAGWWDATVPEPVRMNVTKNIDREREAGVTPRSEEELDYTTFGELGDIVRANWALFADTFNN